MCTASRHTREREAAKMSFPVPAPDGADQVLPQRRVPTSSKEYELARHQYRQEVSALRKMYKAQWDARREVEAAEAKEARRRLMVRKAENKRLKDIRKRKIAAKHERTRARDNAAARARRNFKLAARNAYLDRVSAARKEWIQRLEADSATWIPEDRIDEMISPATFDMTYPWHLEEWYARRERRRQLNAARARGEDIGDAAKSYDAANFVAEVSQRKELEFKDATLAGAGGDGRPPLGTLELLEGDESIFVNDPPEHMRTDRDRTMFQGAWESDDDMLDGFGSDWEEDVPKLNWFGRAEAMARTGVQLEELYAEESMVDIKARLEQFEAAHDAKFPMPEGSPEFWAQMAMEMQQGHFSEPKHMRETEEELLAPFEEEAAKRRAVLEELETPAGSASDDGSGASE